MVVHQGVDFFDIHARSCHSPGTNNESYLDQNILVLTLPGAYDFKGWVNATAKKPYSMFHCLGPHVTEQARFLIDELYIVHIPHFKQYVSL